MFREKKDISLLAILYLDGKNLGDTFVSRYPQSNWDDARRYLAIVRLKMEKTAGKENEKVA